MSDKQQRVTFKLNPQPHLAGRRVRECSHKDYRRPPMTFAEVLYLGALLPSAR